MRFRQLSACRAPPRAVLGWNYEELWTQPEFHSGTRTPGPLRMMLDQQVMALIPSFKFFSQIKNPNSSACMVFIDEHEQTLIDSEFGMPTDFYDGSHDWWDMPANRHSQGANLSFADGHAEHWKWVYPKIFVNWIQPALPQEMPDYNHLRAAMRQNFN